MQNSPISNPTPKKKVMKKIVLYTYIYFPIYNMFSFSFTEKTTLLYILSTVYKNSCFPTTFSILNALFLFSCPFDR